MKIELLPVDAKAARVLADRLGMTVDAWVSSLIREEAAIEITNWRSTPKPTDTPPTPSTAQPQHPQAVQS